MTLDLLSLNHISRLSEFAVRMDLCVDRHNLLKMEYKPMGTGAANRCMHLQYPAKQQQSKAGTR